MRFGKIFSLLLPVLVCAANLFADEVAPLSFEYVAANQQQAYWDSLMRFKMFGAEGILFNCGNVKVYDKVGWVGTSHGDFVLKNNRHLVGGPVVVNGNLQFDDGDDDFSTGPVRVTKDVTTSNFGGTNHISGNVCVKGNAAQKFQQAASSDSLFVGGNYGSCPKEVPQIMEDLNIPKFVYSGEHQEDEIQLDNGEKIITVEKLGANKTYDLLIPGITMRNNSTLYINMPKGGQSTRLFLQRLDINAQSRILVRYPDSTGKYQVASLEDYGGDLLVYIDGDVTFDARTNDYPLHGTYMSTGTLTVKQQLTLSGQLLARKLVVDANFDGTGFVFRPFKSPWIKPAADSWGIVYESSENEGKKQKLSVELSKVPTTDVLFRYCFEFESKAGNASESDLDFSQESYTETTGIPLCRLNQYHWAKFNRNQDTLANPIYVYVKNDSDVEDDEKFYIVIDSLQGAKFGEDDNTTKGRFEIVIKDDDRIPVCHDTTIVGTEDEVYVFTSGGRTQFPAFNNDGVTPLDSFGVLILEKPRNLFTVFDIPVRADAISSKNHLWNTKYYPAENENNKSVDGAHYDTLTFAVQVFGNVHSDPCKMYIDITPVNDVPVLKDVVITISEKTSKDTLLLQLLGTDADGDALTYAIDSGDVKLFGLAGDALDFIQLLDTLDYETAKDHQHKLKIKVSDADTSSYGYVTIKLTDEQEPPFFNHGDTTFYVYEHATKDSLFGQVSASDVDAADKGKLRYTYKVIEGSDFADAIEFSTTSGAFSVKSSTALNYETTDSYLVWAIVYDTKGNRDSVQVSIVVKDINETPTIQDSTVEISEMIQNNDVVVGLRYEDLDTKSILENTGFHQLVFTLMPCTNQKACNAASAADVRSDVVDIFGVNASGEVIVLDESKIDYETLDTYYMMVEVRDNVNGVPSLADTAVVKVKLYNVNEPPEFDKKSYVYTVNEHEADVVVFEEAVHATDKDKNTTLKYSFADGALKDPSGRFSIDATTGKISTVSTFDYETQDTLYKFKVYVTDNTDGLHGNVPLTDSADVQVTVKDINEAPTFTKSKDYYQKDSVISIPETQANGTLLTLNFEDLDILSKGANAGFHVLTISAPIDCELKSCDLGSSKEIDTDVASMFSVTMNSDKKSAVLKLIGSSKLNYETDSIYNMLVEVRDNVGKEPSLADTVVIRVKITNVNEPPQFDKKNYAFSIEENKNPTMFSEPVKATDKDFHSVLTYTFADGKTIDATGKFSIKTVSNVAYISTTEPLDYEEKQSYTFKVYVKDNGVAAEGGAMTDSTTVTVSVMDVNEQPEAEDVDCVIAETASKGTAPTMELNGATVKCAVVGKDPDIYNTKFNVLSYDWNDLNERGADIFSINPSTGAILLDKANALDADVEGGDYYELSVRVADNGAPNPLDTIVKVRIRIQEVNEPPFLKDTTITVSEKTAENTLIATLVGTDAETPSSLRYNITSSTPRADFKIASQTGKGLLRVKNKLDYDQDSVYTLKVTVTDAGNLTHTATVTVLVTDENEPPYFNDDQPYFYIAEHNKAGDVAGQLDAEDDDVNPKYNKLTYSLVADTSGLFEVSEDGYVSVRDADVLNYESVPKDQLPPIYEITVAVTDGEFTVEAIATIEVTDINEKPTLADTTFHMEEHNRDAKADRVVGTDKDYWLKSGSDSLYYQILETNAVFNVATNGVISLKKELNYEEKAEYSFQVIVTDKGSPAMKDTATITIIVDDVNERPQAWDQEFWISETSKYPDSVGTFTNVKDDDTPGTSFHTLTFAPGDTVVGDNSTKATEYFSINKSTGKITVKNGASFDYETKDSTYYLKVIVSDKGSPVKRDTALVTIHITDTHEPPEFPKNIPDFDVDENSPEDVLVGNISATDNDLDEELSYTLENLDGSKSSEFKIFYEDNKAEIRVRENANLDHELVGSYQVRVIVTDKDNLSDSIVVTIVINDVDELPTVKPQSFDVYENNDPGDVLGTVKTGDLDTAARFTKHSFEAVGGDTTLFKVTKEGKVVAKTKMDYEEYEEKGQTEFTLVVKVIDVFDPTLTATDTMHITLKNVNEAPEVTTKELSIPEDAKTGDLVGVLEAIDPDHETEFTYQLVGSSKEFVVNSDGSVTVKKGADLDFETTSEYTIKVLAKDSSGLNSPVASVVVKITDVNESPTLNDTTIVVREDTRKDTKVGTLKATDPDKDPKYSTLTYTQLDNSKVFKVNEKGEIFLKDTLDYETVKSYKLLVEVSDGEYTDTAEVIIKIDNVVEYSDLTITRVETKDSVWFFPDTVYTNRDSIDLEWTEDNVVHFGREPTKEGCYQIVKMYKDDHKDYAGYDTLVVCMSSKNPIVTISTKDSNQVAGNIYTIVEEKDEADTAYYVNKKQSDVYVTVKDPDDPSSKKSFTVSVDLEPVSVPSSEMKTIESIADYKVSVDQDAPNSVTIKMDDNRYMVTYEEKVKGETVRVTYYTDAEGEILENEEGKKVSTISYTTKIDGKEVTISYEANAETGKLIPSSTGSNYKVSYTSETKGNSVEITYEIDKKGNLKQDEEGNSSYIVSYTYVNKYGNATTQSIEMVLDTEPPEVKIITPGDRETVYGNFVEVQWSVNGVIQDSLNTQSLEKGYNKIIRFYRDKAGNETSATVMVLAKNVKDVEISVENPVTVMTQDKVEEYYASNPPAKDQTYAVSMYNAKEEREEEILKGTGSGSKELKEPKEVYPGMKGHLGPTLQIQVKTPMYSNVGGLATLDDLVGKDGMIALDGVDADNSEKMTVDEYVEEYCLAEFKKNLGSDISRASLYKTKVDVKIWLYTNLSQFTDYFHYSMDVNDPDYVTDAGMMTMNFEQKPDRDGDLRTKDGRLYGTGAYLYKTEVTMNSVLQCTMPPVNNDKGGKKGQKRRVSEDLLQSFGYKRPSNK